MTTLDAYLSAVKARATDGDKGVRTPEGAARERKRRKNGWDLNSTAVSHEAGGTPAQFLARKERARKKGAKLGISLTSLSLQAAAWATPAARDGRDGRASQKTMEKNSRPLNEQAVQLVGSGRGQSGSRAGTGNTAQLNPAHSLWLMGYPAEWESFAPQATRSFRGSRRK